MAISQPLSSSMEAVSSASFFPRFTERPCTFQYIKTPTNWLGSKILKSSLTPARSISPTLRLSRIPALPSEELSGGDGNTEEQILRLKSEIGFGLAPEGAVHLSRGKFDGEQPNEIKEERIAEVVTHAGGGTRAGLFRTPISGGVQSATSAHDLPKPALAVRNLLEQARFAHLCTVMSQMHHRREGYPFGSLVDFAPDGMGHPLFSFSPLAIHTRNLLADPRCSMVVQIPGWSGLSNARVTILGDVYPLTEDQQGWAHKQYIAKHQQGPSQQWGNFYYFRMQNISDIYFIGGFGTVAWVDVKEYENLKPDKIAVNGGEHNLKELNVLFSKPLKDLLSRETEVDDVALISIDSKGTDIRVRQGAQFNIQRMSFEEGHLVETLEEAKAALRKIINKGKVHNLHK
ncbi:unnamed protein product [Cuscuta epithymum]|uniref:CREG-like beta-barrel domain-containing protein n=1 Tax=Cuscuta epithymum TaxID=186058 RepID=A0AAV0F3T4_9ASTE|nr:unnamed protein product [Cuscuta epithymum]